MSTDGHVRAAMPEARVERVEISSCADVPQFVGKEGADSPIERSRTVSFAFHMVPTSPLGSPVRRSPVKAATLVHATGAEGPMR